MPSIPPSGGAGAGGELDPVIESMRAQDMAVVDAFEVQFAPRPPGARRAPQTTANTAAIDLSADEEAVVLLETDGVYEWRFRDPALSETTPARRRGPVLEPAHTRAVFDLSPSVEPSEPTVRTYILKFLAGAAVTHGMKFLERNARPGIVVMSADDPQQWNRVEDLSALRLPTDRPARILLFVHGTFSTTRGSYGALGASQWGRDFLAASRGAYDVVIGYDHYTLAEDPSDNATDLLARLEKGAFPLPPQIDAIAFSRGALVLRTFIEQLLPCSRLGGRVRRAVFVGGTNGGTQLAEPQNWARLIDLYTNLAAAASRAIGLLGAPHAGLILREAVSSLGALVKYMASAAVTDRKVPGLAAMEPNGTLVRELNEDRPGRATTADALYYVIASDFEAKLDFDSPDLPNALKRWLLDALVDSLQGEANDLVVHTAAMAAIGPRGSAFVKDQLSLGRNPHVYHTIYFTRPEVTAALTRWLELPAGTVAARPRSAPHAETLGSLVDENFVVAETEDPFVVVMERLDVEAPSYVVLRRPHSYGVYHYAFSVPELMRVKREMPQEEADREMWHVLDRFPELQLHETSASQEADVREPLTEQILGRVPLDPRSPMARRTVLLEGTVPRGVVEPMSEMVSTADLRIIDVPTKSQPTESVTPPTLPSRRRRGPASGTQEPQPQPPTTAPFFFSATMPGEVRVRHTAQLFVTISRDELQQALSGLTATGEADVDLTQRLVVQLVAKTNFEVVGDDRAIIDPTKRRKYELLFEVRATALDTGELWVVIRQGPETLTILRLAPKIVAAEPNEAAPNIMTTAEAAGQSGARYPVLQIFERRNGDERSYQFALDLGDGKVVSGESPVLESDRAAYVASIYQKIEDFWISHENDVDNFEQAMRAYGGDLLDQLVPVNVQDELWKARDALTAIHVLSEEPFVPWEIVHLKPPPGSDGVPSTLPNETHFLAQKGLVRWLHNRGAAAREIRIRKGRAFYSVPDYPHPDYVLPDSQAEIPFLRDHLLAEMVDAEANTLRVLFQGDKPVDLFHFSGHGEAVASANQTESTVAQLLMRGRVEGDDYIPIYFDDDKVRQFGRLVGADGNRPLVVLNACQVGRANWKLTSIGGFAEAFIRAGAGAFVSTLWSVGDQPARYFTEAFYASLLGDGALADAALAGREAARAAREATWLAYVVYGHPNATVRVERR